MKKLKFLMMLVVVACSLSGCINSQPETPLPKDRVNESSVTNPYLITEEEALANLEAFFAANNQGQTRTATPMPRIKKITGVRNHDLATRGETGDSTILLYIANFDDEQGFALLSADKRVSSLVVGVSEKGEISEEILECYEQIMNDRTLYAGFPLDGPGFFTDSIPEEAPQMCMNPNTVNYYVEEEGDTLVGNLDTSEYDLLGTNMKPHLTAENQIELLILEGAINYVRSNIKNIPVNDNKLVDHLVSEWEDPGTGGGGYADNKETDVVTKGPLLTAFVGWRQSPDLNIYFPTVRKPFSHKKRKAYTGCYPLALAKVLAHNRKPETYTYHDHTFNWDIINNYRFGPSDEVALFLRAVADGCNPWYFYKGTFVFPNRAEKFLKRIGYSNVKNRKNSFDRIKEMIDNDHPLVICGVPKYKITNAHAWNIDGYRTSKRGSKDIKMVHCDFGWGGKYNGYYLDNVFNLGSEDNIYDNNNHSGDDKKLNHHNRILVYD